MFADQIDDLAYDIAFWMQGLDNPACSLDELSTLSNELCEKLRTLAIMVLLSKGKADRFHHNLIRSGRVRCAYLERVHREQAFEQHDFVAGILAPLFDAVAAGDFALAQRMASLSPQAFRPGHEYEDDHCYAQIIFRLIQGPQADAGIPPWLARLAELGRGDDDPRVRVCTALLSRDADAFADAFDALLRARQDEIDAGVARGEIEDPVVMTQRLVYIDGLALLRLAQARGIATESEYAFCPSLARRPLVEPCPVP